MTTYPWFAPDGVTIYYRAEVRMDRDLFETGSCGCRMCVERRLVESQSQTANEKARNLFLSLLTPEQGALWRSHSYVQVPSGIGDIGQFYRVFENQMVARYWLRHMQIGPPVIETYCISLNHQRFSPYDDILAKYLALRYREGYFLREAKGSGWCTLSPGSSRYYRHNIDLSEETPCLPNVTLA